MADSGLDRTVSDEELVTRILDGETHLFEILVQRHSRRLIGLATSVLRNGAEAEDAVQDSFLSAYQYLAQFQGRAKFSTWLSRIALHRSFALASRHGRHVSLDEADDEHPVHVALDPRPSPEQNVYLNQLSGLLGAAVAELPESYRSVLVMRELDQMDTQETARRLRLSQANVKVRLHRARAMVRAYYDKVLASGVLPAEAGATMMAAVL